MSRNLKKMSLENSACKSKKKDMGMCLSPGTMCLSVCGVKKCVLVAVLLTKNLVKSSELVELMRWGGGGGQRKGGNVLKSQ